MKTTWTTPLLVASLLVVACAVGACQPAAPSLASVVRSAMLSANDDNLSLDPYVAVLTDPQNQLTVAEVSDPALASAFTAVGPTTALRQVMGAPPWRRFAVRNESSQAASYYVEVATNAPSAVTFLAPDASGAYAPVPAGAIHPDLSRPVPSRSFVFPVTVPAGAEVVYYVRAHPASTPTRTGLILWHPDAYERVDKLQTGVWGGVVGALLMCASLSLLLAVALRDRHYLLLGAFAGAYGLLNAVSGSAGMQLLAPDQPMLWALLHAGLSAATVITYIAFNDAFLALGTRMPVVHRLALAAMATTAACWVLVPLGQPRLGAALLVAIASLTSIALVVAAAILARQGSRSARYVLLALAISAGVSLLANVGRLGLSAWGPWADLVAPTTILALLLVLSLALAENINDLRRETSESAQRLRDYLDAIPVAVSVYDASLKPVYVNQATRRLVRMGREAPALTYQAANETFPSYVAGTQTPYPWDRQPLVLALQGHEAYADDIEALIGSRRVAFEAWAKPLRNPAGEVHTVVTTGLDITERRATEVELANYRSHLEDLVEVRTESERRQREVAEALQATARALTRSLDREEVLSAILRELRRVSDFDGAALAFIEEDELVVQTATGRFQAMVGSSAPLDDSLPLATALQMAQTPLWAGFGHESTADTRVVSLPLVSDGEPMGLLMVAEWLSPPPGEWHLAVLQAFADQAATAVTNARLHRQAQQMAAGRERERLARDLHDAVTQTICSANLLADTALELWDTNPAAARRPVEDLRWMLVSAVAEMRMMLVELRPAALVAVPLDAVLRHVIDAFSGRTHVPVTCHLDVSSSQPPPEEIRVAVYRIAQEAFNNIARHAHAGQVTVWLEASSHELLLSITDNGRGFDPAQVAADHLGLEIMEERARAAGLALNIESCPGQGTKVVVRWRREA